MLRKPGHLISTRVVACEPVLDPFSICEWVRAEQAGGPRLESSQRACVCVQSMRAPYIIWLTAAACIQEGRTTAMRLALGSGCRQDLVVERHTRTLSRCV